MKAIVTKFMIFSLLIIAGFVSSCGGGGGGSESGGGGGGVAPTPPSSNNINSRVILLSDQVVSPANAYALENIATPKPSGGSSDCFELVTLPSGKTYTTDFTTWSAKVSYTIHNKCDSAQMINDVAVISKFMINGATLPAGMQISNSQQGSPYLTIVTQPDGADIDANTTSPACTEAQYETCNWAKIPAGGLNTISLIVYPTTAITSFSVDNVYIKGSTPPPPPPPGFGKLNASIDATALRNACTGSCDIQVRVQANGIDLPQIIHITPDIISKPQPYVDSFISLLTPAQYTLRVDTATLPNPYVAADISPSAGIQLLSGQTGTISVLFKNDTPKDGKIIVTAQNPAAGVFDKIGPVTGTLTDLTESSSQSYSINLGGTTTISNLSLEHDYLVHLTGVADPASGNYFTFDDKVVKSLTKVGATAQMKPSKVTTLASVPFTVTPPKSTAVNVTFGHDNTPKYIYKTDVLTTGTYMFDANDTVMVNPDNVSKYMVTITPKQPLVIGGSSIPDQVTVKYTEGSLSKSIVGYITNSSAGCNPGASFLLMSEVAQAGYNVIVVGFGAMLSDNTFGFYGNQFDAYSTWATIHHSTCESQFNASIINDLQLAKRKYGLKYALISVGGANNTINLDTAANNPAITDAMVDFLNQYGFDGVDFDIETSTDTYSQSLLTVIQRLISKKPGIIITAAPQMNALESGANPPIWLVTTGVKRDYDPAIQAGLFDALWFQAYNTGGYTIDGQSEETVGFPAAAINFLLSPSALITIPQKTLIFAGEPATGICLGSSTSFGVYTNPIYTNVDQIYQGFAATYADPKIQSLAQYGGAMVWTATGDATNGCKFVNAVSKGVYGGSAPAITCPTQAALTTYHGAVDIHTINNSCTSS